MVILDQERKLDMFVNSFMDINKDDGEGRSKYYNF